MPADWTQVFLEIPERHPGATEREIAQLLESVSAPLSDSELAEITQSQRNPFQKGHPLYDSYRPFDPRLWRLPSASLPEDYLSLLRWSNGGLMRAECVNFAPLFEAAEVRGYMLAYHLPQYMPDAVPIGFDGGGNFFVYDLRSSGSKPPLLFVDSGNQCFRDAEVLGTILDCICTGRVG